MSESMNAKIKKLLNLAERAGTPGEAEAASRMAERLMLKWGIDEAVIRSMDDGAKPETIVVKYTSTFPTTLIKPRMGIAYSVVLGMGNMKAWISGSTMAVMGFESDVDRALMFIPSIIIQGDHAMAHWWKSYEYRTTLTAAESKRAKRAFLSSFGSEVKRRLVSMRAEEVEVSEANTTVSTALVLRDRAKAVEDQFNERFADGMRKGRSLKGSAHGGAAGREAGARANLGGKAVGGSPRGVLGG